MRRWLLPLLLLSVACAYSSSESGTVQGGLDVLMNETPAVLKGKRVGFITNQTAVASDGTSAIDMLHSNEDFELVALFSPEHGIRGAAAEGEDVSSAVDRATGLPIHSLYGESRKPTPEMLEGIDALIFDIQDIGSRTYTYISTMALAMEAAADAGIPFVVLDRPNPIGGSIVEGNMLDTAFATFVGMYPIPVRHGMTVGELARLFNDRFGIGADLTVVPVAGWERDEWFDETGLPWINPSPNIRSLAAATHYPGTVFLEGTNLSEGRGTARPFEQTGAPWLDADSIVAEMNAMKLPGVRFDRVDIEVDSAAARYPGQVIPGVRLVTTDRAAYRPVRTGILLIDAIYRLHKDEWEWRVSHFDRLAGTDQLRLAIESGDLTRLLDEWDADAARFREIRTPFLLY